MFDYIFVIASVIIGLALTHLLKGLVQIAQDPKRWPPYWVHLVWVAYMFLQTAFWWWWEYRYHSVDHWTFQLYFFVLTYAVVIYLTCAMLFPRDLDEYGTFREYYYSRRRWFFGVLAVLFLIDFPDTWFKGSGHFADLGAEYLVGETLQATLCIACMFVRNERFHATYAVAGLAYQVSWALRYFETVN